MLLPGWPGLQAPCRRADRRSAQGIAGSSPARIAAVVQGPWPQSRFPAQIQSWLADFDRDDEELTEDYPASIRTRVFYVLDAAPQASGVPLLRIDPMTVALAARTTTPARSNATRRIRFRIRRNTFGRPI